MSICIKSEPVSIRDGIIGVFNRLIDFDDAMTSLNRHAFPLLQVEFALVGQMVVGNPMCGIKVGDFNAIPLEQAGDPIKVRTVADEKGIPFPGMKRLIARIDHIDRISQI